MAKEQAPPEVKTFTPEGSSKESTVLCLNPDSKYPYSFGPAKAKLILANIDAIKDFVEEYGGDK